MTDQNYNPAVNPNDPNTNNENLDIFGGSDDIFENNDLLQPIKETLEWEIDLSKNQTPEQNSDSNMDNFSDPDPSSWETNNYTQNDYETKKDDELSDENKDNNDNFDNFTPIQEISTQTEDQNDENLDKEDSFPLQNNSFEQDKDENIPTLQTDPADNYQVDQSWLDSNWNGSSNDNTETTVDFLDDDSVIVDAQPVAQNISESQEKEDNIIEDQEFDKIENIDTIEETLPESTQDIAENTQEDVADEVEEIEEIAEDVQEDVQEDYQDDDQDDIQEDVSEKILEKTPTVEDIKQEEDQADEEDEESEKETTGESQEWDEEDEEEDVEEEEQESDEEDIDSEIQAEKEEGTQRETKIEVDDDKSDLQKRFYELLREVNSVCELVEKDPANDWFDLVWWNDDRQKTIYKIFAEEDLIHIERTETNKQDESTVEHSLDFDLPEKSLLVYIDDDLLYDESRDLVENQNKKLQVMEKLNKFIFLVTEEYKKIEKQKKDKNKENEMKWIFRNF